MKNSNLSFLFLEARKSKTRHLQSQGLAGLLLCFLVMSLAAEGDRPVIFVCEVIDSNCPKGPMFYWYQYVSEASVFSKIFKDTNI